MEITTDLCPRCPRCANLYNDDTRLLLDVEGNFVTVSCEQECGYTWTQLAVPNWTAADYTKR